MGMAMDARSLALVMTVVSFMICHVACFRFELEGSGNKCFSEDLYVKGLVLAQYHVVSENSPKISAKVNSPYGSSLHTQDHVTKGEFAFTANEIGEYTACFWIPEASKESKTTVDLDWKTGIDAKDWDSVAKREKIDGVELELRKLEGAVNDIHENMMYLRDRCSTWQPLFTWRGVAEGRGVLAFDTEMAVPCLQSNSAGYAPL